MKSYNQPIFSLLILFSSILLATFSNAATITITGSTSVCPGVTQSYTASASNLFGSVNGHFLWGFFENGQWTYYNGLACHENSNKSSTTMDYTWQYTGNNQIKVQFIAALTIDCTPDTKYLNVNVRVFEPGIPTDASGGLTFCSSSETKTITIPGIPYDAEHCNYHYKYDWVFPSGWTAVPTDDNIGFTSITGGIRTFATSVNVTAPSTSLTQGYGGNYIIIVRTEPAWPYLRENSKQIWIGSPQNPGSINGSSTVNEGGLYQYSVSASQGVQTYNWTWPSNWAAPSSTQKSTASVTPWSNSGYVTVTPSNSCGNASTSSKFVTVNTCSNCRIFVSPNPAAENITIGFVDLIAESFTAAQFSLHDSFGFLVLSGELNNSEQLLDFNQLKNGMYVMTIRLSNGEIEKHRIVIKK